MIATSMPVDKDRPAGKIAYGPIAFFFVYLNVTLAIFAYGPWPWPIEDGTYFYSFLIACHVAIVGGYVLASKRPPGANRWRFKPERLLLASVVVNLLLLIPTVLVRTEGDLSPAAALADPGQAYAQAQMAAGSGASTIVMVIRMFMGPLSFMLLPLTVMFWERLGLGLRYLAVLTIALNTASWVLVGTNKGIGDLVIQLPWLLAARIGSGKVRLSRGRILTMAAAVVGLFVVFVLFFVTTQASRLGDVEVPEKFGPTGIYVDKQAPLYAATPEALQPAFRGLGGYLTNGYYGLYQCMQLPWVPTYGAGNSIFLSIVEERVFDSTYLQENDYPGRLQSASGWPRLNLWHSAYAWIASDVTFPGVVVVMFGVGWLFALAWKDALHTDNPFASAMVVHFVVMLTYLPANNQVVQAAEGFSSFYVLLGVWLYTRRALPETGG